MSVFVISADIISGNDLHDIFIDKNAQNLLELVRCGRLPASIKGPPCETFTKVRFRDTGQRNQPRPLRSVALLWGLLQLRVREHEQVFVSNLLLQYALDIFLCLVQNMGVSVIEHPSDPGDGYPAIWKLPEVRRLLLLGAVDRVHFLQGPLGQVSPKPTMLLVARLPSLRSCIHDMSLSAFLRRAKVLEVFNADASFATAATKTYPARMCAATFLAIWRTFAAQVIPAIALHEGYAQCLLQCTALCCRSEAGDGLQPKLALRADADFRLHDLAVWPDVDASLGSDFNAAARGYA